MTTDNASRLRLRDGRTATVKSSQLVKYSDPPMLVVTVEIPADPCPNGCGQPYDLLHGHLDDSWAVTPAETACLAHVATQRRTRSWWRRLISQPQQRTKARDPQ